MHAQAAQVRSEGETPRRETSSRAAVAGDYRLGFRSLEVETRTPRELEVAAGALPPGLAGTLLRIGPARNDVYGERFHHWFDGDGMVHALTFAGGRVTYKNRFVATLAKAEEDRAHRRLYGGFGTRAPGGPLARLLRRDRRKNAANTNIVAHGGKLLALFEGGRPHRLDIETLDTIGEDDMSGTLRESNDTFSAHPKVDRATGEMVNFGIAYGKEAEARIYRTTKDGVTTRAFVVPLPMMAMVHDFALTPTKVILVVAPATLPRVPIGLILGQRTFGESIRYRPELGVRIAVVDRATGEVRWSRTSPFVMFHTIHAWDEGAEVVVDVCAYPDAGILRTFEDVMAGAELSPARAWPERLRVRADGSVERTRLSEASLEFPRVAGRAFGRDATRIYGVTWADGADFLNQPIAIDLARGAALRAPMRPWEYAGECVPVSKPDATSESDVWLLTLVLDARAQRTELRILDGADITAPPTAVVPLPHVVPFGFHGNFVAA
jgi:all-trans-8'-apo-beta-carotenal 15,15'-oxygenase